MKYYCKKLQVINVLGFVLDAAAEICGSVFTKENAVKKIVKKEITEKDIFEDPEKYAPELKKLLGICTNLPANKIVKIYAEILGCDKKELVNKKNYMLNNQQQYLFIINVNFAESQQQ